MSRIATSYVGTGLEGRTPLGAISLSTLSPTWIARHLARASLAAYVVTQIVTQCSTLSTSITSIHWQNVDMACKAFCVALALASLPHLLPYGVVPRWRRAHAVAVEEPPKENEIGVAFLGEDALKVELHIRRTSEGIVVAKETDQAGVRNYRPEVVIPGVQPFLRELGN